MQESYADSAEMTKESHFILFFAEETYDIHQYNFMRDNFKNPTFLKKTLVIVFYLF